MRIKIEKGIDNGRAYLYDGRWSYQYIDDRGKKRSMSYAKYLWEKSFGDVPDGYVLGYKDRDSSNCVLDNLELLTHSEFSQRATAWQVGRKLDKSIKKKISKAHKGKKLSDEHRNKIGEVTKKRWEDGVYDSPEIRESWSINAKKHIAKKGTKISKSRKLKVSSGLKAFYSNEQNRKAKSVIAIRTNSSESLRKKKSDKMKKFYEDHPDEREKISNRFKGREFSDEHRKKLSDATKRTIARGEQSRFWRGKGFADPYPDEFTYYLRSKIRERDNHECQACFKNVRKSRHGHVHHISGNKQDCSEGNLILLCDACHIAVHGKNNLTNDKIEELKLLLE